MSNIVINGRREEGKSTLALSILKKLHQGIVICDFRGDQFDGVKVYSQAELEDAIDERLWMQAPIVYICDNGEESFGEVCEVLFPERFTKGGFGFLIDESDSNGLQTHQSINPALRRVIKQHPTHPPREAVTVVQTTHFLGDLHRTSKGLVNEYYVFSVTDYNSVKAVSYFCGDEVAAIVPTLPKHHCVRYFAGRRDEGLPQFEIWDKPEIWFVEKSGSDDSFQPLQVEGGSEMVQ